MPNDKLVETAEERGLKYADMLQDLGGHFLRNRKRFKFALNRVSDRLDGREFADLQALNRDRKIESPSEFEDRFEEICGATDSGDKRETVRLMLRHM